MGLIHVVGEIDIDIGCYVGNKTVLSRSDINVSN